MTFGKTSGKMRGLRQAGMLLMKAAVLAMVVALALPGHAAGDRAIKSKVPPVYPELAKRMKIGGVVKIEATVDADGKVTDVKTLSGSHTLSPAAEDAVRKWKFVSGDGTATVDVDVNFAINQ
jgi:TonB family protein